jgi:hypothetical protein
VFAQMIDPVAGGVAESDELAPPHTSPCFGDRNGSNNDIGRAQ